MAPTLKEVATAIDSTTACALRGELTAGSTAPSSEIDSSVPGMVVPSSSNIKSDENETLSPRSNDAAPLPLPPQAKREDDEDGDNGDSDEPPSINIQHETKSIQLENPDQVHGDEGDFIVAPHFDSQNAFHRNLSDWDLSMRCAICKELYHCPVTLLPCLHNFCSLCVRHHFKATYTGMKRKANCPTCHEPVRLPGSSDYEKGILPNKQLEQQVSLYRQCRDPLRKELVELDVLRQEKRFGCWHNNMEEQERVDAGEKEERNNSMKRGKAKEVRSEGNGMRSSKRARRAASNNRSYSPKVSMDVDSNDDDDENDADYNESSSIHNSKKPYATSPDRVAKAPPQQLPSSPQKQPLQRKPIITYHNLPKRKLIQLCRDEGLDTHGTDKELRARHSDYITLYNSECDSEHPRSAKELVRELKSRERSIKVCASDPKARQHGKCMKKVYASAEAQGGSVGRVETGNKKFDDEWNAGFAKLLANGRKGRQGKRLAEKEAKMEEGEDGEDDVEVKIGDVEKSDGVVVKSRVKRSSKGDSAYAVSTDCDDAVRSKNANMPTSQPSKVPIPSFGLTGNNEAVSPSVSIDSDKTVETPQKAHPPKENLCNRTSSPPSFKSPSKSKPSNVRKPAASKKKTLSKSTLQPSPTKRKLSTRIPTLGPWSCRICTYLNERNTTKKAKCEMCGNARPPEEERRSEDVDVVNIDC